MDPDDADGSAVLNQPEIINPALSGCPDFLLFFIRQDESCSSVHVQEKSIKLFKARPALFTSILDIYSCSESTCKHSSPLQYLFCLSCTFTPLLIPLSVYHLLLSPSTASRPHHDKSPAHGNYTGPVWALLSRHNASRSALHLLSTHKWRIRISPSGAAWKTTPSPHDSRFLIIRSPNPNMDSWPLTLRRNPSCQRREWTLKTQQQQHQGLERSSQPCHPPSFLSVWVLFISVLSILSGCTKYQRRPVRYLQQKQFKKDSAINQGSPPSSLSAELKDSLFNGSIFETVKNNGGNGVLRTDLVIRRLRRSVMHAGHTR